MADAVNGNGKPKSFKDINIYSRKFLLCLAGVAFIAYGMFYGKLPWKDGANYIAWIVSIYCLAEGYADGKGNQIGSVLKTALGAGILTIPTVTAPTAPPDPKPADGGEATPA